MRVGAGLHVPGGDVDCEQDMAGAALALQTPASLRAGRQDSRVVPWD